MAGRLRRDPTRPAKGSAAELSLNGHVLLLSGVTDGEAQPMIQSDLSEKEPTLRFFRRMLGDQPLLTLDRIGTVVPAPIRPRCGQLRRHS